MNQACERILMTQTKLNPKVDDFLNRETKWKTEFEHFRKIILDCDLTEELKWGQPTYTLNDKNVVLIHGFKEYCAILFVKGALLQDPRGILIQQTENVQAARQIRFKDVQTIDELEPVLKDYIKAAIENEKAGKEIEFKKATEYPIPEELTLKFYDRPELKTAFEALTPGRQRGYLLFFSAPKQASTRVSRIEKYTDKIMEGKGLDD